WLQPCLLKIYSHMVTFWGNYEGISQGKVWFAGRGTAPEWQMKREMLSQCYTTKWRDIPLARLG
ncbi:DUF4113 domain-containing protein, partial [Escherichia coli]|uniref:DUF4113 domain-containing protein n=1 Tax=Escherichia coli TaxID=562 RepID=UPI00292B854F